MAKKSSSKMDKPEQIREEDEKPVEEQKNPGKLGNEIDEIFSGKKRKKPQQGKNNSERATEDSAKERKPLKRKKNKKKSNQGADDNPFADAPSKPRKKTEDGFTIYTEDELGINKRDAGGTPLCPFDCSCCF